MMMMMMMMMPKTATYYEDVFEVCHDDGDDHDDCYQHQHPNTPEMRGSWYGVGPSAGFTLCTALIP